MRATRLKAEKSPTGKTSKQIFAENERAEIEKIFDEHGIPGWVGWGTYGAESSYGKNNGSGFGFGLIEPSYKVAAGTKSPRAGDVYYNAQLAAEIYEGLLRTYDLPQAVVHYSGSSYTIAHLHELGGNKGSSYLEQHGGKDTEGTLGEPGLPEISIGNPLNTIGDLIGILTSGETWIRLGEILAGAVLVIIGLKGLSGVELPSAVPVPV